MKVLHLGFEDPTMPGAGGGSLRTHEINRRLAAMGHDVTVLTTRFPGSHQRVQDGVRYVPVGFGVGRNRLTRLLGYVLGLPAAVRRYRGADLVVEDFFAPFSSMAAPYWTRRPTIGVVQWLHARDKSRQYRLPFHLVERAGVRSHSRLIAVSYDTAAQLTAMNPAVNVHVIGNGVDRELFAEPARLGRNVVFIGRLELRQKGLDLLMRAWARAELESDIRLVVAGTGPDEAAVRRLAQELGIAHRVDFVGWVRGADKRTLLSEARLLVVPSRQETFGIVALEGLAAGTPVLAFDIHCLREILPAGCSWRIPAFDVEQFASTLAELAGNDALLRSAGAQGRDFASRYDWDLLAARQAEVYRASVAPGARLA